MTKALLIAEKPSAKRTIEAFYEKHRGEIGIDIDFFNQRGHLLALKTPDEIDEELKKWSWENLPIHPEEHGGWQYKVINEKKVGNFPTAKERYVSIGNALKNGNYDFVINAGDADQEGELLVRIVLSALRNKLPVKRFWTNDMTEEKVVEALKNLGDDDHDPMYVNLLCAAYARQRSDYRYGMNVSRAASLKMGGRVACGRVKTPIMSLVCKREKEIENFKPQTTYGVQAEYSEGFTANLFSPGSGSEESGKEDDQDSGLIYFQSREEAEAVIGELSNNATVVEYVKKREESYAPKLYKLATAQIDAARFGFDASKTLEIIQSLYDKGFMSYPRTGCEYLSSNENFSRMLKSASCVPSLAKYVSSVKADVISRVKNTKKWVNDAKLKESGHSALVPTTKAPDFSALPEEEKKIYEMVCRRFVAIFLPPLVQDKVRIITDNGREHCFKRNGSVLVSKGYAEIFGKDFTDNIIPEHRKGDVLDVDRYKVSEKTSKCPSRYTDGTLIAACEEPLKYLDDIGLKELGKKLRIGTDATRAEIIKELIVRDKYLQKKAMKKTEYIVPTESGMQIYENLKDLEICKVDLTGRWELLLEDIRAGKLSLNSMEEKIRRDVETLIDEIKNATGMKEIKAASRKKIGICPECGGDIISGPKGFYCSRYKEGCRFGAFKKVCDSIVTDAEFASLMKGEEITKTIRKDNKSWSQKLRYDIKEHKVVFVQDEFTASETVFICPHCGGKITEERWKYSCGCGFAFWKAPYKGQKEFTKEQVASFFAHGTTGVVKGLKSKKGTTFSAEFILSEDKMKSEMKFTENRRKNYGR